MPLPPVAYDQAPFAGMQDSLDPTTGNPTQALLLGNCFPAPGPDGTDVEGRPGFRQLGAQLGSGGNRRVQGFHQFTKADGTEYTVAFVGGLMYTLNWATRVWSNVALSGVSLDATARIRCVTFANVMVVSDGVNRPWTWDGTTFVDLTNAPVAYGPPAVFYGKLFLIKATNRIRMVWSEENQPNVGYEAVTPANAWDLYQTGTAPLERLLGTNEALYYWRARSIGKITGAVTPDFSTSGTREGVSETVGTRSPDSVAIYDSVISFVSADGQPFRFVTGGPLEDLWKDVRETYPTWPKTAIGNAWSISYPPAVLVLMGVPGEANTDISQYLAVDHQHSRVAGLWSGFVSTAIGLLKDLEHNVVFLHGSANGYVYDHGNPDGAYWDDQANVADGGTNPIDHTVIGTPLGYAVARPKRWMRLDFTLRLLTTLTDLLVDYELPNGQQSGALAVTVLGASARWDEAVWDVDLWASSVVERHVAIGLGERLGRWVRPRLRHSHGEERFALLAVKASGGLDADAPEEP